VIAALMWLLAVTLIYCSLISTALNAQYVYSQMNIQQENNNQRTACRLIQSY